MLSFNFLSASTYFSPLLTDAPVLNPHAFPEMRSAEHLEVHGCEAA